MLWKVSDLRTFSLRGKDGAIGNVPDFLFSDDSWMVRYLVVATGDGVERKEVLIPPLVLDPPIGSARVIPTDLTRDQVLWAPSIDTRKSVSRHYEGRYYDQFLWPYDWIGGPMWGPYFTPGELARATVNAAPDLIDEPENPHLRSTNEVEDYHLVGRDGVVGHIRDFIVSDDIWSIRYLEVDTRNWWPGGKKVLLEARWAREVNWLERKLVADVSREEVKSAPAYEEDESITAEYEHELADHYRLGSEVAVFR